MLGATTVGATGAVSSTVYLFTGDALLISFIVATTVTLGILLFTVSKRYANAKKQTALNAEIISIYPAIERLSGQKEAA
jgi:hypothetical protein